MVARTRNARAARRRLPTPNLARCDSRRHHITSHDAEPIIHQTLSERTTKREARRAVRWHRWMPSAEIKISLHFRSHEYVNWPCLCMREASAEALFGRRERVAIRAAERRAEFAPIAIDRSTNPAADEGWLLRARAGARDRGRPSFRGSATRATRARADPDRDPIRPARARARARRAPTRIVFPGLGFGEERAHAGVLLGGWDGMGCHPSSSQPGTVHSPTHFRP